jgi:hypothetical protein
MLLKDILEVEKKKNNIKKQIYEKVYEQFTRKIRTAVELNQKQVFLQVPAFLFGFPTFDRAKATDYLKRQLENSGFDVTRMENDMLYTSWYKKKPAQEKNRDQEPELPNLANLRKLAVKYGSAPHRQ